MDDLVVLVFYNIKKVNATQSRAGFQIIIAISHHNQYTIYEAFISTCYSSFFGADPPYKLNNELCTLFVYLYLYQICKCTYFAHAPFMCFRNLSENMCGGEIKHYLKKRRITGNHCFNISSITIYFVSGHRP